MSVELGVFDLSRLPIKWDEVDPLMLERAVQQINESTKQQCEELQAQTAPAREETSDSAATSSADEDEDE